MSVKVIRRRWNGRGRARTKITPTFDDFANGITEKWVLLYPEGDSDAPDEPTVEYRATKPPYDEKKDEEEK